MPLPVVDSNHQRRACASHNRCLKRRTFASPLAPYKGIRKSRSGRGQWGEPTASDPKEWGIFCRARQAAFGLAWRASSTESGSARRAQLAIPLARYRQAALVLGRAIPVPAGPAMSGSGSARTMLIPSPSPSFAAKALPLRQVGRPPRAQRSVLSLALGANASRPPEFPAQTAG
jgi:hypothetical protein